MAVLRYAITLYSFVLLARVILSWIPIAYDSPFRPVADAIHALTEPVLGPIRRALPSMGGLDLSPLIVLIGLNLVSQAL